MRSVRACPLEDQADPLDRKQLSLLHAVYWNVHPPALTQQNSLRAAVGWLVLVCFCSLLSSCSEERRISTVSDQALNVYNNGVQQWEKFYYPEALHEFDNAIALDSNFAMAWARRALLDESIGDAAKARRDMSRAMGLLSGVTRYEQMFIRLQNLRLHFLTAAAATLADSMIVLYPGDKEIHLIRGNLYEGERNYERAIRSYRRAIEIDTSFALAVMSLGYAYSTIGEQDRAVAQMTRYIRLAPDAADPRASFGDILLRVGRYDEALTQYQKSLDLKPDYWYSINQIGQIYTAQGKLNAAEAQFHKGIALLPQSPQSEASHSTVDGTLNALRGKFKEAAAQFVAALRIDSTNVEAAYGLANALRKLKDFKRAREILGRIHVELERRNLTSSQSMMRYNLMKSRLELDQGDVGTARALCDSALEFATVLTRGPVFQQIAEINVHEGRYEDALDACEEALRVNPNSPDALLTLVKAYKGKRDGLMVNEIGGRLLEFWKNADADFTTVKELKQLIGPKPARPGARGSPAFIAASSSLLICSFI